jgi:hypothetical protein
MKKFLFAKEYAAKDANNVDRKAAVKATIMLFAKYFPKEYWVKTL